MDEQESRLLPKPYTLESLADALGIEVTGDLRSPSS